MQNVKLVISGIALGALLGLSTPASAEGRDASAIGVGSASSTDTELEAAREAFIRANALAKQMRWSEALADFQASMSTRPHAATAYNIGLCHRALGQYSRAYAAFEIAQVRGRATPGELTPDLAEDARTYSSEVQRLLVRVELDLEPSPVQMLVDGRSLELGSLAGEAVWFTSTHAPTSPEMTTNSRFVLVLDPGTHLLVFSRVGFKNVLVRRDFAPGEQLSLPLKLDSLPGRLSITANVPGAVVRVDALDEGVLPISLSRPPGRHRIEVRHPDYLDYGTDVVLRGGEETSILASLSTKPKAITKQWWFWGVATTVVGVAITGTIMATRPAAQRPAVDGGSLGWHVDLH